MQQKIKSLLLSYKSSNALTINILSPFPATSNKSCPFSDNAEYIDTMLEYCAFESLFKFVMTILSFVFHQRSCQNNNCPYRLNEH